MPLYGFNENKLREEVWSAQKTNQEFYSTNTQIQNVKDDTDSKFTNLSAEVVKNQVNIKQCMDDLTTHEARTVFSKCIILQNLQITEGTSDQVIVIDLSGYPLNDRFFATITVNRTGNSDAYVGVIESANAVSKQIGFRLKNVTNPTKTEVLEEAWAVINIAGNNTADIQIMNYGGGS